MHKKITYAQSGVDRKLRLKSKGGLDFEETYVHSLYGSVLRLPYGNLMPIDKSCKVYQDHKIEGIGTKVLLAQLANKYDTIGTDAVAMAVNDVIRSGARPFSITDNIDAQKSDSYLVNEWKKGLITGAHDARAPIIDGELADVSVLIRGIRKNKGHHIVCSCVGYVDASDIIYGNKIEPGDVIIGLRSSGLHSNGVSLARRILFKKWGGYYKDPFVKIDELDGELVTEVLKPTKIYSQEILMANARYGLKAAVHITGDAHAKLDKLIKHNPGIGFKLYDLRPQPIFQLIRKTAKKLGGYITYEEMLKTFNLGDGFDVVVSKEVEDDVLDLFEKMGVEAWQVGRVTNSKHIIAHYNGRKVVLK